jgi:DNA-directed RNA polymerase specialized sigma24 family protein
MPCGRQVHGDSDTEDDGPDIADYGLGPEDMVVDQQVEEELRAALPKALDLLTDKQRAAVEFTTNGAHSRRDAATKLCAAPGTISSCAGPGEAPQSTASARHHRGRHHCDRQTVGT